MDDSLPGVTVNGSPGLEDSTPLVLGESIRCSQWIFKGVGLKAGLLATPHFGNPLAMLSQRCLKAGLDCDKVAAAASARSRLPASQS